MLYVYINYPKPHIKIHADPNCNYIMMQSKEERRIIDINAQTLAQEIDKFLQKKYRFASDQALNDMWLKVDFEGDIKFERNTVNFFHSILKKHYRPFVGLEIDVCCKGAS